MTIEITPEELVELESLTVEELEAQLLVLK